jgi:16S rRNA (guanine527-N7)-methyltransferase
VRTNEFKDRLVRRAHRAGISIPDDLATQLEVYYRLLTSWNAKINLTGLNLSENGHEVIDRLLIEPIVAARHVPAGTARMLDIGSGGGSPALPLALATTGVRLVMVESKTRKSVFLREAVRALELEAEVVTARFEELLARPDLHETQDLVSIRAVRIDQAVFSTLQAFTKPRGVVFLFRSSGASKHVESSTPLLAWKATHPLIESLRSQLVVLEKQ